jgi:hypothetical protein
MLIYRCFVLYDRSWKAISGSLFLAISGIALVVASIYLQTTLAPGQQFSSPYKEVQIATWSTTIAINFLTSGAYFSVTDGILQILIRRSWQDSSFGKFDKTNELRMAIQLLAPLSTNPQSQSILRCCSTPRSILWSRACCTPSSQLRLLWRISSTTISIAHCLAWYVTTPAYRDSPDTCFQDINVIGIAFNLIIIRIDRRLVSNSEELHCPARFSDRRFVKTAAGYSSRRTTSSTVATDLELAREKA